MLTISDTEYTQSGNWQEPLSGVRYIPSMLEKLAQPGEGGGCTPTPFHSIYHHVQSCCVSRYTSHISPLFLYVLCDFRAPARPSSRRMRCAWSGPLPTCASRSAAGPRSVLPLPHLIPVLRIRDVYPGSEFFPSWIPIKEFKYFDLKNWFLSPRKYDPGCSSLISDPDPVFYPSRIQGS